MFFSSNLLIEKTNQQNNMISQITYEQMCTVLTCTQAGESKSSHNNVSNWTPTSRLTSSGRQGLGLYFKELILTG